MVKGDRDELRNFKSHRGKVRPIVWTVHFIELYSVGTEMGKNRKQVHFVLREWFELWCRCGLAFDQAIAGCLK